MFVGSSRLLPGQGTRGLANKKSRREASAAVGLNV